MRDGQPERRTRRLDCPSGGFRRAPEAAMRKLRRRKLLRQFAQRKARHARGLRGIGDPLLVVPAAPRRHQRMQRIPVGHAIRLGGEAWIAAPLRRSHRDEPRRPLTVLAGRDRRVAVARRQDADRGAVAVGQALARAASAVLPGTGELAHGHRRQRFLDRHVDDRARHVRLRRMHPRTRGGEPADERRLLAHRTDRRLGEIVHLPGQQPRDAAGIHQGQIARRIVRFRPALTERRDEHQRGRRIHPTQRIGIALLRA